MNTFFKNLHCKNAERTVYERILELNSSNNDDGLEENEIAFGDGAIRFGDGMMDRMPFLKQSVSRRRLNGLIESLALGAAGKSDAAFRKLKRTPLHKGVRWADISDDVRPFVEDNSEMILTPGMHTFLRMIFLKSTVLEEVKMALDLYGLFQTSDEEADEVILNYAKSSEFALMAMPLVKRMKNGNQILFEIARDTTGGGRVTAAELLDPETKEIEDWIFREGTDPFLSFYYSSVNISKKCNLPERMCDSALTDEDYYLICRIVYGYYEEGYAEGLDTLDQRPILEAFFALCESRIRPFSIDILCCLQERLDEIEKMSRYGLIPEAVYCREQCERILNSDRVHTEIEKHVRQGEWMHCGRVLGMLDDSLVLAAIQKDPEENFMCLDYLTDRYSKKEALDIYLNSPFREKLSQDDRLMEMTALNILRTSSELGIINEEYFDAVISMNHFLLSNIAANIVKGQHEKGAAVSESLFQKAEQYGLKL